MGGKPFFISLSVLFLFVLLVLDFPAEGREEDLYTKIRISLIKGDKKAPDFSLLDLHGRKVGLKQFRGKIILLNFWATWCGPCMQELPNVVKVYKKYHKKGFDIIGINLDLDKGQLKGVMKESGMTWAQYFDGTGWDNKFAKQFGIPSIPSMWLIDKKGILVDLNARNKLEENIEKLLAEK